MWLFGKYQRPRLREYYSENMPAQSRLPAGNSYGQHDSTCITVYTIPWIRFGTATVVNFCLAISFNINMRWQMLVRS